MINRELLAKIETAGGFKSLLPQLDFQFLEKIGSFALNSGQCQDLDFGLKWCSAAATLVPTLSHAATDLSGELVSRLDETIRRNQQRPPLEIPTIAPSPAGHGGGARPKGIAILTDGHSRKLDRLVARLRQDQAFTSSLIVLQIDCQWRERPYATADGPWYPPAAVEHDGERVWSATPCAPTHILRSWHELAAIPSIADYAFIAVGMPRIPEEIIRLARFGILNPHNGLLPLVRGLDSPAWSFMENIPFGFTVHFIDQDLDVGHVVAREVIAGGAKQDFDTRIVETTYQCAVGLMNCGALRMAELPVGPYFFRTSLATRQLLNNLYSPT